MSTATPPTLPNPLIPWLAVNRKAAGWVLIVVALLLGAIPTTLAVKFGMEYIVATVLTGLIAVVPLGVGVMLQALPATGGREERELIRILLLVLGGGVGLLTAAVGVVLFYYWWEDLTRLLRLGERDNAWRVLAALAVLIGGLGLMFVSLQVVRAEGRSSAVLRRMLYGYNAVLTGLLLLLILAVVNVLVSVKLTGVIDATASGQFSISDRTTKLLKEELDRPVRFNVIWPSDEDITLDMVRSLMTTFQDANPSVQVRYLSPTYDREALAELMQKYPRKIEERRGILIVQGEEKPENATFLKMNDLFAEEGFGPTASFKFRGEDKIVAALTGPGAGKEKTVVYITQGAGEPDMNNSAPGGFGAEATPGLGVLKDRLIARGNFDVRPLRFNPADPKVPDDCGVLVVANPKAPVPPPVEQGIRSYLLDRKGKAVVLLDVTPAPAGEKLMPPTGLERLLGEFGVEVTNQRVITVLGTAGGAEPVDAGVFDVSEDLARSRNELARAFANTQFSLPSVRLVRAAPGSRNPMLRVEPLLVTQEGALCWAESDPAADLFQKLRMILTNRAEAERIVPKDRLSGAVVVSESGPPASPHGGPPPESKPRLAVFGDTTWVSNEADRRRPNNYAFFASTLDWLSDRPSSIGIGSKDLSIYVMEPSAADKFGRLIGLPAALALVAIAGLGLGVWVVRRR